VGALRVPTAGSVELRDGDLVLPPSAHRRACAWVLQNNVLLTGRSTIDNVAIGALAGGIPLSKATRAASDALDLLGLVDRRDFVVDSLSGGEKQRVTIARSLISPSRVILADEPTGNLDRANTGLVVDSLRAAASTGRIVVVATHDPAVVVACDTSLRLREPIGDR
jgi:ABC-type lipoprotein export system ATPase subunit